MVDLPANDVWLQTSKCVCCHAFSMGIWLLSHGEMGYLTNMNQQYKPWVQIANKIRQLRCTRWVPQPVALSPDNWTMICKMLDITRFRTRTIWRRHSQMQQLRENCHLRTKTYLYILSTILNHLGTFEWQTMKPPATYWYHGPVKDFVPESCHSHTRWIGN